MKYKKTEKGKICTENQFITKEVKEAAFNI